MGFVLGLLMGMLFGALALMWVAKNVCEMTFEAFMEKAEVKLEKWAHDV